jgi:hypothetical protein
MRYPSTYNITWKIFDVIEQRMSEVRKGTSRNTENENKRCKIFNKVLNMNWDYVRGMGIQNVIFLKHILMR